MDDQRERRRPIGIVVATASAALHDWVVRSAPSRAGVGGPVTDGAALARLAREGHVDVCICDVALDGGPEAVMAVLADVAPAARTLAWAATDDDPALLEALAAGAAGCLGGTPDGDALRRALDDLMAGRPPLPRALTAQLVAALRPA